MIEADAAWQAGYSGQGWYVAIFDTGVDTSHEMFAGKTIAEACFSSTIEGIISAFVYMQICTVFLVGSSVSACPNGEDTQFGPGSGQTCSVCNFSPPSSYPMPLTILSCSSMTAGTEHTLLE